MSKKHSDPEVYLAAAHYQFHFQTDFVKARDYLKFGIKNHKKYKPLYIESFGMEIKHMVNTQDNFLFNAWAKFLEYIKHFKNDLQFHISLLDKLLTDDVSRELQHHIVRYFKF